MILIINSLSRNKCLAEEIIILVEMETETNLINLLVYVKHIPVFWTPGDLAIFSAESKKTAKVLYLFSWCFRRMCLGDTESRENRSISSIF
jgi:hypothetical protein